MVSSEVLSISARESLYTFREHQPLLVSGGLYPVRKSIELGFPEDGTLDIFGSSFVEHAIPVKFQQRLDQIFVERELFYPDIKFVAEFLQTAPDCYTLQSVAHHDKAGSVAEYYFTHTDTGFPLSVFRSDTMDDVRVHAVETFDNVTFIQFGFVQTRRGVDQARHVQILMAMLTSVKSPFGKQPTELWGYQQVWRTGLGPNVQEG
jgi:hypothetical protein